LRGRRGRKGARARADGGGAREGEGRLPRGAVPQAARDPRAAGDLVGPGVPAIGAEPGADALAVAPPERLAGVTEREAIDVAEVAVVLDPHDTAEERDVPVPRVGVEDGQRRARIAPQEAEAK